MMRLSEASVGRHVRLHVKEEDHSWIVDGIVESVEVAWDKILWYNLMNGTAKRRMFIFEVSILVHRHGLF